MIDWLGDLAGWVLGIIDAAGYLGVVFLVTLENLFPPIPSEVVLPLAGFLSGRTVLWFPGVVLAASTGSVVGALILYAVGYRLGLDGVRRLIRRFGRWLFLEERDLDQAQDWFGRHGEKAVLIGRVVPFMRSAISIPAGICRMPLTRFVLFTALGSTVWNFALVGLGWVLGENWPLVAQYTDYLEYLVLFLLAVAVLWFIWSRWCSRHAGSG